MSPLIRGIVFINAFIFALGYSIYLMVDSNIRLYFIQPSNLIILLSLPYFALMAFYELSNTSHNTAIKDFFARYIYSFIFGMAYQEIIDFINPLKDGLYSNNSHLMVEFIIYMTLAIVGIFDLLSKYRKKDSPKLVDIIVITIITGILCIISLSVVDVWNSFTIRTAIVKYSDIFIYSIAGYALANLIISVY